jgi:hypothetical protein
MTLFEWFVPYEHNFVQRIVSQAAKARLSQNSTLSMKDYETYIVHL